jgi:E3 ubiquitin-protein ligase HUWE1
LIFDTIFGFLAIFSQEYYDAVFALISYFITTQTGGTMVISAGIVPTLLQLLHNKNPQQSKVNFSYIH